MRPLFARLVLLACMLTAVIGCSDDATSPTLNNSNESSLRDGSGDAQQPPLHGGTIGGFVFDDLDGDGFLGFGERILSGIPVTLRRTGSGGGGLGTQRITRSNASGHYAFESLTAGTYQVFVTASSRSSASPAPRQVTLTETNGDVSDDLDADLGVLATDDDDDDQGGDIDRLTVGAFISVRGDYFPDSDILLASNWGVTNCRGAAACGLGRLRGPITFIDDRTNSFAVMGTLMRAGEETFPLYAQLGQRAEVLLHDGVGNDFIADLVRPWFSLQDEIHGRIEAVTFRDNTARLVVLDTVVLLVGIDTGND